MESQLLFSRVSIKSVITEAPTQPNERTNEGTNDCVLSFGPLLTERHDLLIACQALDLMLTDRHDLSSHSNGLQSS